MCVGQNAGASSAASGCKAAGISEADLPQPERTGGKADVPLRTIQQYEQKQKNINHARADYVIRLAKALYCRPEDLLEVEILQ